MEQITKEDYSDIVFEIYKKWEGDLKKENPLYSIMQRKAEEQILLFDHIILYKKIPILSPDLLPYFVVEILIEKGYIKSPRKKLKTEKV